MKNLQEFLKTCSKDEQSFKKLLKLIEELVEKREEAKNHLNLLERAIKSDYDSIVVTTLELEDPGPKIVYVNDGFTRMTGYSRDEAIGNSPRMLQGPKTDRAVLDTLKKRLQEGQSFFGHTVNYRKDGSEFINQWDIHPLTNDEGEITHWVSYQHDITERKRSENKVMDTQIEFDRLTEESKKTLADLDVQGNIVTTNKAFRDLLGYDDDELKKKKIWHLLDDKHVESFRHRFDKFKPSDFQDSVFELLMVNKMGHPVEVKAETRLLSVDGQTVVRASFQNKSLQKRIMAMLKQRSNNLERLFDKSKDFRYRMVKGNDGEYVISSVSAYFSSITGLPEEQAEGMSWKELVHPDDVPMVQKHFERVTDGMPNTEQYRIRSAGGTYIKAIDYAKPVWNADKTSVEEIKGSISTEISSEFKNTTLQT